MTALVKRFESGTIEPGAFGHLEHLKVAHALLAGRPFLTAARDYLAGIERIATAAGAPAKVNLTMTLAYLALLAEKMRHMPGGDADALLAAHPELMDRKLLERWYSSARLASDAARRQFLLPDRCASD